MIERIKNEPVLVVGLVNALLALALAYGVDVSKEQAAAILGIVNAALAVVARSRVTPVQ